MTERLHGTHHARWMGDCIYILKMLIVGDLFPLGAQEKVDVMVLSFYIIYMHFFYWFSATVAANIPGLTLDLHRDLNAWKSQDDAGARAAIKKVDLHTEYLTGRSVILALASDKTSDSTKGAMARKLQTFDSNTHIEMGKPSMPRIYEDSSLVDFVDEESWCIFQVNMLLNHE